LDRAPKTVAHLRALAAGEKEWTQKGRRVKKPLYDGSLFHRVVPGLLIQTGDPAGTGFGDPKAPVADEAAGAKFDRAGLLGMASWGPGSSQTQFFITLGPAPDLDGLHTLFGEVIEGLDAANAIAAVPRDETSGSDRPHDPPVLRRMRIVDQRP
jgi:peptidyl-prolyl cis-trans isomerase A (cyclophilin A)